MQIANFGTESGDIPTDHTDITRTVKIILQTTFTQIQQLR